MRYRVKLVREGFIYGALAVATLPTGAANSQTPPATVAQPLAAAVTTVPTAIRPNPSAPVIEEREDPFSPSLTDAEKRADNERRIREMVQPMINQMRDAISQGMGAQIDQNVRKMMEGMKREEPAPTAPASQAVQKTDPERQLSAEQKQEEDAEARAQELYDKAKALVEDPEPKKQALGRALMEQVDRGIMPRWTSNEGVFFIGCVNKRRMYRDKFGDVFTSEFWFNGSSGTGNSTGGTGVIQNTAARQPQQRTASLSSGGQSTSLAVDPCAN